MRHLTWILMIVSSSLFAGEGMWIPLLLGQMNEADMRANGMKMTAEDIYSVNKGSLKDAIVSFGGFCTAEVISNQGLLLTNHHCGFDAIQNLSSLTDDYVSNGFWAFDHSQELPAKGLSATFIVSIHDVSESVLAGVTPGMSESERSAKIKSNIEATQAKWTIEKWQETMVRAFYYGNQYFLFVTETYKDVRLVGTPPSSIGKFGADTDNWVWPRHTGDFSMFRIYAGPDNKPAEYSSANVPMKPKHSLPISLDGVDEGDFTMVIGFPGRTQQYLPSEAIAYTQELGDPTRIRLREKALALIDDEMRRSPETRLRYVAKQATIANGWKKWKGEVLGLKRSNAVAQRRMEEDQFNGRVRQNEKWKKAGFDTIVNALNDRYRRGGQLMQAREFHSEIVNLIELFKAANMLQSAQKAFEAEGAAGWNKRIGALEASLEEFYKEFDPMLDQLVFATIMDDYFDNYKYVLPSLKDKEHLTLAWGSDLYTASALANRDKMMAMLKQSPETASKALLADAGYQLFIELSNAFKTSVDGPNSILMAEINQLQRTYMQALMEVAQQHKEILYPDANSTLRVTYGKVAGYEPRDAVVYEPYTWLDGVVEKFVPGDYEFDLPPKLIDLYKSKDYGVYAAANGKVPVCFLGSNHTTGGNSGSPAIDAYGNLVGLNFDRVWEGTMSDINYDARICRNIMVDARYVLFIVDKYAGAKNIIDEMTLVHPKTGAPQIAPKDKTPPPTPSQPEPPKKLRNSKYGEAKE